MSAEMLISIIPSPTSSWAFNEGRDGTAPSPHGKGCAGGRDADVVPSPPALLCCKAANFINPAQLGTSLVSLKAMFSVIVYDTTCYILVIFPLVDHQSTVKHCS